MDKEMIEGLITQYNTHWWFQARHSIISHVLSLIIESQKQNHILDIGCGSGMMLSELQKYGVVDAIEPNEIVRTYALEHNPDVTISPSLLPDIDFDDNTYDLITAFDVVEHIEQDKLLIENIHKKLKQGGQCMVTVPAFPFMWSHHDEVNHHFRRYTKNTLCSLFNDSHLFSITYCSYYNCYLFPIAFGVRMLKNLFKIKGKNEAEKSSGIVNTICFRIFKKEQQRIYKKSFPFGLSLLLIARKK